jgi:hypothetical protein
MAKFKIGDKARHTFSKIKGMKPNPKFAHFKDKEVLIVSEAFTVPERLQHIAGDTNAYWIEYNGIRCKSLESQLEPLTKPPLVKWEDVERITGWSPHKETVH